MYISFIYLNALLQTFFDLICFKEFQKDNPSLVPQSLMSRGKKPNVSYLGNQFSRGYFSSGKKNCSITTPGANSCFPCL